MYLGSVYFVRGAGKKKSTMELEQSACHDCSLLPCNYSKELNSCVDA
jgi:hypothetical protein